MYRCFRYTLMSVLTTYMCNKSKDRVNWYPVSIRSVEKFWGVKEKKQNKKRIDLRRTRTCNLLIRSQAPYHWASRPVVEILASNLIYEPQQHSNTCSLYLCGLLDTTTGKQ